MEEAGKLQHQPRPALDPYIGHSNPVSLVPVREGDHSDSLRQPYLPDPAACMPPWWLIAAAVRRASHACGHVPDRSLQKPIPVGREGALGAQAHPVAEQHSADGQVRHPAAKAVAEHGGPLRRPALLGLRGPPVTLSAMATLPVGSTGTPSLAGPTRAPTLGHRCGKQKRCYMEGANTAPAGLPGVEGGWGGGASIPGGTPPPVPEPRPNYPAMHPTCARPRLPPSPGSLQTLTSPST